MLSLRTLAPDLPIAAALSSSHLANLILPSGLSRLYIALDDDVAGREAAEHLRARADAAGIAAHLLIPPRDDWNTALQDAGRARCCAQLADQLHRDDTARFLAAATAIDVMA
jgi:DNA primase